MISHRDLQTKYGFAVGQVIEASVTASSAAGSSTSSNYMGAGMVREGTDDTVDPVYAVPVLQAEASGSTVNLRWTVAADSTVTVSYEYQTLNSAGTVLT